MTVQDPRDPNPPPRVAAALADTDVTPPPLPVPTEDPAARQTWAEFRQSRRDETMLFGAPVPFIGRRADIEKLYNLVRDALNRKQPRVIWLHGHEGLGKTRLVLELERAVAPDKRRVGWLAVASGPQVAGPPTLAGRVLLELLGGAELLRQPDPWSATAVRLAPLLGDVDVAEVMVWAGPLLGLALHGIAQEDATVFEVRPEAAVQRLASYLSRRATLSPLVVHLGGSQAQTAELTMLATGLRAALGPCPVAILIDTEAPPPEGAPFDAHRLASLDVEAMRTLARQIGKRVVGIQQNHADALADRADGSPERLLDLLRGMVAAGEIAFQEGQWTLRTSQRERSALPQRQEQRAAQPRSTLPDRLARLPAELREALDAAAIFGGVLWFGGVLSVLRGGRADPAASLTERDRSQLKSVMLQLQGLDVLAFVEDSTVLRELEFAFVHPTDPAALVAEMQGEQRSLYARLAAQWLAGRPRTDPVADNARIAELYEQGGRGRLAAQFFLEAGNAARTVGQTQRALALFEAGSRNAGADDADVACDLRTAHGGSLMRLSRNKEAEPTLLEALHMARCLDDDLRCGEVQLRIAQVARHSGRYDTALQFLDGALQHLRVAGAHRWIADVSDEMGLVHLVRGDVDAYKTALSHFLKALALRRRSEDKRVLARSLCHIARVHVGRGHFADAMEAVGEAVQVCDTIQDRWGAAESRTVMGEVYFAAGKLKQALQTWDGAMRLAHEVGDVSRHLELIILRAETLIALGDWQQAAALMFDALELAKEVSDPELLSGIYRVQAAISLERSAVETADLDSERAVQVARDSGARLQVARALLVRACVLATHVLTDGGSRAAVMDRRCTEAFEEALTILREMGDIVRLAGGLRQYGAYLGQRGGGPRLAAVQARLRDVEAEMTRVSGS